MCVCVYAFIYIYIIYTDTYIPITKHFSIHLFSQEKKHLSSFLPHFSYSTSHSKQSYNIQWQSHWISFLEASQESPILSQTHEAWETEAQKVITKWHCSFTNKNKSCVIPLDCTQFNLKIYTSNPHLKIWDWVTMILLQPKKFLMMATHVAVQVCPLLGHAHSLTWNYKVLSGNMNICSHHSSSSTFFWWLFYVSSARTEIRRKTNLVMTHLKATIFCSQGLNRSRAR